MGVLIINFMKNAILIFSFILPLLNACGDNHHHGESAVVQLDNGKRWKANPETTAGVAEMQNILAGYEGRTGEADARKALRKELEAAFQNIFKQCTMTGAAHDQLHNYLLPMKGLFEKLESDTAGESEQAFQDLKKHLADYQTYFE
ncbi:MAG: hypothetical protein DYG98_16075 [Haliscomenobacteraceae bacterium CHB4]|nr:hypothetical protein [Haliscomenobacteraceae bacterium CHB4]